MFVLAHLSDPHLAPFPQPRVRELTSKRLLGYVNWRLHRHAYHRREVVDALVADLHGAAPDHIAVTGDLINIALEQEFGTAREWLDHLGPPDRVTLVPGNHDVYVRATARHARNTWDARMLGDVDTHGPNEFPFVRRRGPLALIGLSSALPTAPFFASGKLGADQIARLAALLPQLADCFRVVLVHHPPLGRRPWHKRLIDATPFLQVLAAHGAELVLHGHDHQHSLHWVDGAGGRIPVVGVPSASAAMGGREDDPAAYNLYRVAGTPGGWRCEMVVRGLHAGRIGEIARRPLKA
jgi:3',5'-cyclic AMP phosphodiesterase CpdA